MTTILKILLRTLLYAVYAVVGFVLACLLAEGISLVMDQIHKWALPVFMGLVVLAVCALFATGTVLEWDKESDKEDEP